MPNLDADRREQLRIEIATLTREAGMTAIYITHDQSEAFALADRIGVLNHGQLVQLDTPENMRRWFAIVDQLTEHSGLVTSELVPALRAAGPGIERGALTLAPVRSPRQL